MNPSGLETPADGADSHDANRRGEPSSAQAAWDAGVLGASGHLLQSWRWGEFKERHGWQVERVRVDDASKTAFAQVLFKHRGPVSLGYIPRGPAFSPPSAALAHHLFSEIDRACRQRRAISVIVEPDVPLPFPGRYRDAGFVGGPAPIQPSRTVKVPLLDDDALLKQMHQKTRYNVRLAQRRGVIATRAVPDESAVNTFFELMNDTAGRNKFGIHDRDYYDDFLRIFGDDAVLLFAWIDDIPVAGVIAARFGDEGIYMYGGSSTRHRAHGAGFFLQFEAMRWARERGCQRYDLWGIPTVDPKTTRLEGANRVAGSRGDDWRGLYEFKIRFGGEVIGYPAPLERRYIPFAAPLARRVTAYGG